LSTQGKEGERRKEFEVLEYFPVCATQAKEGERRKEFEVSE